MFPLPRIDDTLDALKEANGSLTWSLKSGYWQGTSHGNADALSRDPVESCKHCTNAEKKFGMETDISVKVLTTEDAWSSSEVQKAQLEDLLLANSGEKLN
ncbi:hypothetical protein AVEN_95240-1 [Araneus ventricosus]|uniref:Uncharacterized protein n=1 Tax=Araneus ventricosus TaxID=182803 RepID=A0A4Y2DFQ6_ARAVE|nr:hypothetical protein AVEN_95240-1 [Araneus ventricosus]